MHNENLFNTNMRIRCSVDYGWVSFEDLIHASCKECHPNDIDEIIRKCRQLLADKCCLHLKMAPWGDGSQGWSCCLAVQTENIHSLIGLLLGEDAKSRAWSAMAKATIEKGRHSFIEVNRPNWEAIGRWFQNRRESLGLSAQDVAVAIDVSRTVIRNLERGKPVSRAPLVESAYRHFLNYYNLTQSIYSHFKDMCQVAESLVSFFQSLQELIHELPPVVQSQWQMLPSYSLYAQSANEVIQSFERLTQSQGQVVESAKQINQCPRDEYMEDGDQEEIVEASGLMTAVESHKTRR